MEREPRTAVLARATTGALLALVFVAGLLLVGATTSSARAMQADPEVHPEWGRTFAEDGVLKRRCRNYRYGYAITPPEGEWALETFLVGPGGHALSSGAMAIGTDTLSGYDKFRFCKASTRPGVFTIRALLSVQDTTGDNYQSGWLPETTFRLRARR